MLYRIFIAKIAVIAYVVTCCLCVDGLVAYMWKSSLVLT